jgi:hypothetical protein
MYKTFQDAIDITSKLDIQYIWIDSICIIHGQAMEWEAECPKMGVVYGNAYCTSSSQHHMLVMVVVAALALGRAQKVQLQASEQKTITVTVSEKIDHDVWQKEEPSWQLWDDTNLPLFRRA